MFEGCILQAWDPREARPAHLLAKEKRDRRLVWRSLHVDTRSWLVYGDGMRTDRLHTITLAIEAHPEHFDMREFVLVDGADPQGKSESDAIREWACGTTACIAGWACHLWEEEIPEGRFDIHTTAEKILGLTEEEADKLFYLTSWDTPELAVAGLRDIIAGAEIPDPWEDSV